MNSTQQAPTVEISVIELLHIMQHSTSIVSLDLGKRIASKLVIELKNRGYIDNKTLGNILGELNPDIQRPEKLTIATRTVPHWWPEEMGENGLMWRDVKKN